MPNSKSIPKLCWNITQYGVKFLVFIWPSANMSKFGAVIGPLRTKHIHRLVRTKCTAWKLHLFIFLQTTPPNFDRTFSAHLLPAVSESIKVKPLLQKGRSNLEINTWPDSMRYGQNVEQANWSRGIGRSGVSSSFSLSASSTSTK